MIPKTRKRQLLNSRERSAPFFKVPVENREPGKYPTRTWGGFPMQGGAILRRLSGEPPIDSSPPASGSSWEEASIQFRDKKLHSGRRPTRNPTRAIRRRYQASPETFARGANRVAAGGNTNWFRTRGPRGASCSRLRPDSVVPLARVAVVSSLPASRDSIFSSRAPICHSGIVKNPTSNALPSLHGRNTRTYPSEQ